MRSATPFIFSRVIPGIVLSDDQYCAVIAWADGELGRGANRGALEIAAFELQLSLENSDA